MRMSTVMLEWHQVLTDAREVLLHFGAVGLDGEHVRYHVLDGS